MEPSSREQLSTLIHDLNGNWGIIYACTQLSEQANLSLADYQLYEDVVSRNILNAQFALARIRGYFFQEALFTVIEELLEHFKLHRSTDTLDRLRSLFLELNQLITSINSSKAIAMDIS